MGASYPSLRRYTERPSYPSQGLLYALRSELSVEPYAFTNNGLFHMLPLAYLKPLTSSACLTSH